MLLFLSLLFFLFLLVFPNFFFFHCASRTHWIINEKKDNPIAPKNAQEKKEKRQHTKNIYTLLGVYIYIGVYG